MNADKSTAIMLYNLVEALEAAGARLQHVYFTQVCCALFRWYTRPVNSLTGSMSSCHEPFSKALVPRDA